MSSPVRSSSISSSSNNIGNANGIVAAAVVDVDGCAGMKIPAPVSVPSRPVAAIAKPFLAIGNRVSRVVGAGRKSKFKSSTLSAAPTSATLSPAPTDARGAAEQRWKEEDARVAAMKLRNEQQRYEHKKSACGKGCIQLVKKPWAQCECTGYPKHPANPPRGLTLATKPVPSLLRSYAFDTNGARGRSLDAVPEHKQMEDLLLGDRKVSGGGRGRGGGVGSSAGSSGVGSSSGGSSRGRGTAEQRWREEDARIAAAKAQKEADAQPRYQSQLHACGKGCIVLSKKPWTQCSCTGHPNYRPKAPRRSPPGLGTTAVSRGGKGNKEVYEIPTTTLDDVGEISTGKYTGNTRLGGKLIIPTSVTSVGHGAFRGCSGVVYVTIPDSVKSIGSYAFMDCSGLLSAAIPPSVTSIELHAFSGCSSMTAVDIPNSVTSIGHQAFKGCSWLTSVQFPHSLKSIGWNAFADCTWLTSVVLPTTTSYIESGGYASFPQGCRVERFTAAV